MRIRLSLTKTALFGASAATSAFLWGQVLQPQLAEVAARQPRSLPAAAQVAAPVVRSPKVVTRLRPRAVVASVPATAATQGSAVLISAPVTVAAVSHLPSPPVRQRPPVPVEPAPAPPRPRPRHRRPHQHRLR